MLSSDSVLAKGRGQDRKIGIGAATDLEKVQASASIAHSAGYGRVTVYQSAESLVKALKSGEIDAAVRGNLDSNEVMKAIKKEFAVDHVLRMAILQPRNGKVFFFAPVGVDEGNTVEQKLELVTLGAGLMRRMGIEPRVGVLAGGRITDKGRDSRVDKSLADADEVTLKASQQGITARNAEILIEEAVKDCNLIIGPDGISGNLIFRTLHFLGEGRALGAVVLNIERIFVDTSRAKSSYVDSIALASALVGGKKV
ncbi:MAG TPA: methanogenesis marker protein Mmp4/MtxX [Methanomassiliicoccales archaeon]|jgi:putative methanogen marker protein 4|nr:methanogenesis marker protein Mmp4/MtxX [Methanomassiliicoccales archaeon]